MKLDTHSKLSRTTLVLHWIVGIMMIGLLASGIYMEEFEVFALYPWHKSFGVLIVTFVLLRVLWRIKNGWPSHVSNYSNIDKLLARVVHYVLITGTVLMPISGFMMSVMGGHGVDFFGLEMIARNPDPVNPQEVIALNGTMAGIGHNVHFYAGMAILVGVFLHVAGALKHHVIDKDGTLLRMMSARV